MSPEVWYEDEMGRVPLASKIKGLSDCLDELIKRVVELERKVDDLDRRVR